jgi:hypothetical protein
VQPTKKITVYPFKFIFPFLTASLLCSAEDLVQSETGVDQMNPLANPVAPEHIKSYCIDFNWVRTNRAVKPFAAPGIWADSDPAAHVAWYKAVGANVIQTFAVSCNGYAWTFASK